MLEGGKIFSDDGNLLARLDEMPAELKGSKSLEATIEGVIPLLQQLNANECDAGVVEGLDKMVSLAAGREYKAAGHAYIDMTMGRKKWNNAIASYGGTHCQNKGFRIYITKQDDPNKFDSDPMVEKAR